MMNNKDRQEIFEAMTGAESPSDQHLRETITGGSWLYGLSEPDSDDTVRSWAAREGLRDAAERYAKAAAPKGQSRLSDEHLSQVVQETFDLTNEGWSDLTRLERVAGILDSHAARFERLG
ncbi:hypothetical protein [Brevibacterium casei]